MLEKELGTELASRVSLMPSLPPRIQQETLGIISKLKGGEPGPFFNLARTRFVPMRGDNYAYEIQLDPAIFHSDALEGMALLGNEEDYLKHEILHIKFYEMLPRNVREKMVKWHEMTKQLFYTSDPDFLETEEGKFFLKQAGAMDKVGRIKSEKLDEIKKLMEFVRNITDVSEAYTQFKGNQGGMETFLKSETALKVARAFKELQKRGVNIESLIQKDPRPEAILNEAKGLR